MKILFRIIPALLVICALPAKAAEPDIVGLWITGGNGSRIETFRCGVEICGRLAWIPGPDNPDGTPKLDLKNRDPDLRTRPILGMRLMTGFKPAGPGKWRDGTIYNARDGKTHRVSLRLLGPDRLKVGIWIFGQVWRRAGPQD